MHYENEENLFNQQFREPPLYIFLHNKKYSLIHLLSSQPPKLKIIQSSNNINELIQCANHIQSKEGFPFIKNTIFT